MSRAIFITGTDTGVGKTLFACGLAAFLREAGYKVGVMKPVETGCEERNGERFPRDAADLKEAAGSSEPLETICPYRLRDPLAPSMAADREGVAIDISRLQRIHEEIRSAHDVTLVEGAGGLLVPILPSFTYADFARLLKLPLFVVAANRLGAINHLLLTLEHASCRGLRVLGYVFNRLEREASVAAETNREAVFPLTAVPFIGEIPYLENPEERRRSLPRILRENLDLDLLQSLLGL